jgi:c-di-GMP phosphodiesterase
MCSDTALHSVVSIGLDRLTGGTTAFVNITREHLLGELHKIFDPEAVVLELLESIDGEPAVVDACARAVADGYTLALDDYDGRASLDSLLPLVKIVKVDVLDRDYDALAVQVRSLVARGIQVLAERVETMAVRDRCQAMGCSLFQGYVFSRPETLNGRSISMQQVTMFNIINLLRDPDVGDDALEDAFRTHPALSLALLRIVNSASFGARAVDSINHAIRLIGREALSRWLLVMLVSSVGRSSPVASEAVVQALVRGRFCEVLTTQLGNGEPSTRFLVGLLSRMDVLLGLPIDQVLERLPVSRDVRDALINGTGPHATILSLAIAYEAGDWTVVDVVGTDSVSSPLGEIYGEATAWASERLRSVG